MTVFRKDPNAILDYTWNWSAWLSSGETITDHTVTATPADVSVDSSSVGAGAVTAWLSGGASGTDYEVACHITTDQGRQDERTIIISVADR